MQKLNFFTLIILSLLHFLNADRTLESITDPDIKAIIESSDIVEYLKNVYAQNTVTDKNVNPLFDSQSSIKEDIPDELDLKNKNKNFSYIALALFGILVDIKKSESSNEISIFDRAYNYLKSFFPKNDINPIVAYSLAFSFKNIIILYDSYKKIEQFSELRLEYTEKNIKPIDKLFDEIADLFRKIIDEFKKNDIVKFKKYFKQIESTHERIKDKIEIILTKLKEFINQLKDSNDDTSLNIASSGLMITYNIYNFFQNLNPFDLGINVVSSIFNAVVIGSNIAFKIKINDLISLVRNDLDKIERLNFCSNLIMKYCKILDNDIEEYNNYYSS